LSLPQALTVVTAADVESFLLDLCRKGSTPSTRNVNLAAVRCLLVATTGSDVTASIPRAKVPRRSPKILSGSEVAHQGLSLLLAFRFTRV
jgi:site-specific recombinase XerD